MAVRIRLSRIGKKHAPFFRLVAIDSRKKRDGEVLANIGTYDVLNRRVIQFHEEIYNDWLSKGALPTDSARKLHRLYKKEGVYVAQARQKMERPARVEESNEVAVAE
jgi:small subunit ribosomal protein S16